MDIAIVGGGYVGLVTGVSFAERGHRVVVAERDTSIVAAINAGQPPIHEPGLAEALATVIRGESLRATTDLADAVVGSECVFLCVGTPSKPDGVIDLSDLETAALSVVGITQPDGHKRVLVVKSTVIPGTADRLAIALGAHARWAVASNPEFLREGQALTDARHPDRVVLGVSDNDAARRLHQLYAPFGAPILQMPRAAAEMVKYTSNALLATLISFSNEISDLCEQVRGVSAAEVFRALHLDRRFTPDGTGHAAGITAYLWPGAGYGGSCLPKDTAALAHFARDLGRPATLVEAAQAVNLGRAARLLGLADDALGGLTGRVVAVLGLSFKPDTDDMRESPAIPIVDGLLAVGAEVRVYDPAMESARSRWGTAPGLSYASSLDDALRDADAAMLITVWPEFRSLNMRALPSLMRTPVVIDGRLALAEALLDGVDYRSLGVAAPSPSAGTRATRAIEGRTPMSEPGS